MTTTTPTHATAQRPMLSGRQMLNKVPEITLYFIIFLATILLVVVYLSLARVDATKTDHAGRLIAEPAYEAD
jgi:p-aminobenzoyl-glutamate transporter AbgT